MKNIFEQKNEMEAEKRKLEKKMRNISNISDNNHSLNNNRNNLNQSSQKNLINESTKILDELNNNFVNPQRFERNVPSFNNLNAKLELEEIKNRFLLQQKSFFEELEILKVKKKLF